MFHMKCYVFVFFDKCSLKKKKKKKKKIQCLIFSENYKKNCNLTFKVSHLALDNMTKHCALDNMNVISLKGRR